MLSRLTKFARFAGRYPVSKLPSEMQPDALTQADAGFFSKQDFRRVQGRGSELHSAPSHAQLYRS
jgi:hypothetical protein